jgi:hypothetical protein
MTFIRIATSALVLTLFAAGGVTVEAKGPEARSSAAQVVLTLLGASTAAEARMCDPACRWRCC